MSMRLQLVPKMCTVKWKVNETHDHSVGLLVARNPEVEQQEIVREDFFIDSEISDVEDSALASTISNETDDEVELASVLQDLQQDHFDTSENSVVIACRKHILKSAYMALSKTYFSWHKTPNVQFVGEMADDYGGPSLLMIDVQGSLGIFEGQPENLLFCYS
ncbi:hypothetical protein ATANTOWER_022365 [Ataeniobius toweri]|uniref:Uncharacterized protein n=1 Tax=Ataeniobius toweri TaxID=208326 RepID=A0ABU7A9M6_9TELE|nr:hypothetical protein [Ataeniobius toweri]